jgi:hypothetical protein
VACIDDPHRFTTGRQVSAYFGLVPRQYQSGETNRNGRITKRGNPLARTILVECAWASLRYNEWAKGVYDRICGKQKTRKKKAAVALARKIAVLAWAMLRDEKDWTPTHMIHVTESFGKMKPKENSDQRKSRLRREAREAKAVADRPKKSVRTATAKRSRSKTTVVPNAAPPSNPTKRTTPKSTARTNLKPKPKPRRAGKLVSAV